MYPGNLTAPERMQWLINISQARIHHSQSKTSPNATKSNPENIRSTIIRELFFFAVHVTIGNPTWGVYLLMDTGGDLIWTQCQPCRKCFDLEYGIFDPRISTTYSKLPCDHPLRQGLSNASMINASMMYLTVDHPNKSRAEQKALHLSKDSHFLQPKAARYPLIT
ncbi:hypothetical protein FEM48_Zijuj01G0226100 [Ziziphus jujuba var. spinosa]|uniref:Peptidase A1 domain-containing protein n=1 Tax=Ziziphus jujuba var. spinosa TaxID=714518 RepID=A0A978W3Y5_ZIZJJ|nr:hypothetical protein FEM48_Zijuj01G0226100 [Ziziphus jujuba var. spinosa]